MEAGRAFKPHFFFTFPHDLVTVLAELFQQPRHHLQSRSPGGDQCCESQRYKAVEETATRFMDSVSNACVALPISYSSVRTIACDAAVHWAEVILANNSINPIHLKRKGEPKAPQFASFCYCVGRLTSNADCRTAAAVLFSFCFALNRVDSSHLPSSRANSSSLPPAGEMQGEFVFDRPARRVKTPERIAGHRKQCFRSVDLLR
jgi:hypothetical protein